MMLQNTPGEVVSNTNVSLAAFLAIQPLASFCGTASHKGSTKSSPPVSVRLPVVLLFSPNSLLSIHFPRNNNHLGITPYGRALLKLGLVACHSLNIQFGLCFQYIVTVVFRVSSSSHKTSTRHARGHLVSDNSRNTIFLFAPSQTFETQNPYLSKMRNRGLAQYTITPPTKR